MKPTTNNCIDSNRSILGMDDHKWFWNKGHNKRPGREGWTGIQEKVFQQEYDIWSSSWYDYEI